METSNLTIIMLTVNRVPHNWAQFHKAKLLEAANGQPIITVSREPLDWGLNLIQTEYSFQNIFVQMLRAAKTATTEYVAIADDDTLYTKEHFAFRPNERGFWYNMTRWHLFTWGDPFYFYKPLPGNGLVIANREDMITALENRFAVASELPGDLCHELGSKREARHCDIYKWKAFHTLEPVVSFYHEESLDQANRNHTKKAWPVRALSLPYWGEASQLRTLWN